MTDFPPDFTFLQEEAQKSISKGLCVHLTIQIKNNLEKGAKSMLLTIYASIFES
jgi:hypothetical protein